MLACKPERLFPCESVGGVFYRRWGSLVATVFLAGSSLADGSWTKGDGVYLFAFAWDQYNIRFTVDTMAAERDFNRLKPWSKLTEQERRELSDIGTSRASGNTEANYVNYPLIIKEARPSLKGLCKALEASSPSKDIRCLAEHALGFVQSIPYSTRVSNGGECQTPVGVLLENRGKCDSKSALLAAILAEWNIPWILVGVPRHMFVGMGVPVRHGERTVAQNGRNFLVAETTTAGWAAGATTKNDARMLDAGRFDAIRDTGTAARDKRRYLSEKIETAKVLIARMNRRLVGKEAVPDAVMYRIDRDTNKAIRAEMDAGNLISFGAYPDATQAKTISTTKWTSEN